MNEEFEFNGIETQKFMKKFTPTIPRNEVSLCGEQSRIKEL
jgi:hypothetical protein